MTLNTIAELKTDIRVNLQASQAELNEPSLLSLINQAIQFAESKGLLIPVADETLVVATETYEYPLTGGELGSIKFVEFILQEGNTTGVFDTPVFSNYWVVEKASTPFILFHASMFLDVAIAGKYLRVIGKKPQARVVDDDTDTVDLPPMYVVWKATALGHSALSATMNRRGEWHRSQIGYAEQQAEDARIGAREWKVAPGARRVPGR